MLMEQLNVFQGMLSFFKFFLFVDIFEYILKTCDNYDNFTNTALRTDML